MYLYSFGLTNLFEVFSCALNIGNYNGDVPVVGGWLVDGTVKVQNVMVPRKGCRYVDLLLIT